MLNRLANKEDPDQKQSDLGLHCLSRPLRYTASVGNFTMFSSDLGLCCLRRP